MLSASLLLFLLLPPQDCIHDDQCGAGYCKVWEDHRYVCTPETYAVMVYDSKCLEKIEMSTDAKLEIKLDSNGNPDKSTARLIGAKVTYKSECGHIEVRKRNVSY